MLNQMKKIVVAMLMCCLVLGISSIPVSGIYQDGYPDSYINFSENQLKDNASDLSGNLSMLENASSKNLGINLNFVQLLFKDFTVLTNMRMSNQIQNYQDYYLSILKSTKESLLESIGRDFDEQKEKERISYEIEEDVTDFLNDLLMDDSTE